MAILGVQLVFSMVMASCLSKLSGHFSIARWILCSRLVRFLHPTDEELKTLAGIPTGGGNNKGKGRRFDQKKKDDAFTVPKNMPIQLESAPMQPVDMLPLQYYTEYQWLVDFAFCGIFIYLMTELYYTLLQPQNEFNLSMMWCLLVIGFALKVLTSLTAMYFRTEEGGERILCIVFGFFFLVLAMGILIVDEETLEFGLDNAYHNFSMEAQHFLEKQGISSAGPMSILAFKITLAILCALLGTFMTFPGLRLAKMYSDSLKYCTGSPLVQALLHMNMIMPLFIALMWVKPVMRDYMVRRDHNGQYVLLDDETFETARIIAILLFCLLRFTLIWTHLQSHLNMACDKIERLRKEAGRISSVELQRMVVRVFYYLCVVALQYVAPLILLLYCTFMLKTLGNFSLSSAIKLDIPLRNQTVVPPAPSETPPPAAAAAAAAETEDSIADTAAQFSLALSNLRLVFTATCFRGVFSFLCWWICCTWFTTSAFGMLYYSYFTS